MDTAHYTRLRRRKRTLVPPAVPLALRQLRQTWRLLLFIAIAIVLTAIMVCAVPLYTQVTEAASLRNTLLTTPTSSLITAQTATHQISAQSYALSDQAISAIFQQDVGRYLAGPVKTELTVNQIPLAHSYPSKLANVLVNLVGTPTGDAMGQLRFVAGQFPQAASNRLAVAISQEEATDLGVDVGSHLQLHWPTYISTQSFAVTFVPVTMTVVGIFATPTGADPYWNSLEFGTGTSSVGDPPVIYNILPFLTTSTDLLDEFEQLRGQVHTPNGLPPNALNVPLRIEEDWHASLDPNRLGIEQLNDGITSIDQLDTDILDFAGNENPSVANTTLTGDAVGDTSILKVFRNRNNVPEGPLTLFLIEIIGLSLLFVGVMTELLVGRQTNMIAVMRSRGASRTDIFSALGLQSLAIGVIALIVAPLLAVPLVVVLAQHSLPANDFPVLHALQTQPLHAAQSIGIYALLLALGAILTMGSSIWQIARSDILAMRREAARTTKRPLWQRLNLDVLTIIAALVAYGLTAYINNSGILNATTSIELAPLVVVAPLCLLLATALLFLRFLTVLLQVLQTLTARGRGASAPIALALVARAPRQMVRMTLLLALATALILFTQIFTTSQHQRIYDVAAYQAESDITGTIATSQTTTQPPFSTVQQWTKAYRAIPGVQSATVGFTKTFLDYASARQIEIQAVDADTFAQTAIWPASDAHLALASMMNTLAAQRKDAIMGNYVPAYVDASLWDTLHLQSGHLFTILALSDPAQGGFKFEAMGEIAHLPPIADGSDIPASNDYASGGLIVDYQTAQPIATTDAAQSGLGSPFNLNTAWLKTSSDAHALTTIRTDLNKGKLQLIDLHDRRAIIAALLIDPPYLAIVQVLQIGALVAFLLTMIGSLISSWLDARSRLTNFALLRALGANPSQIARIFLWEQGIVYVTAISLGLVIGFLLSTTVVPPLVFTSGAAVTGATILTDGEFYAIQRTPAVQVIVPTTLIYGLIAFCVVCLIAIASMTRIASRPSISQTLRLNED